jgi:hypothetical protein
MMFELQVRPLDKWPRTFTADRRRGRFTEAYGIVMADCGRELELMGARSAVMLMALADRDIRIDGRPRAGAKPSHPGVILVVETVQHGTLRFPCDTFDDWLANLRAITLHLKALRAIDRYGVSVSGEQYTGWAALPPPNGDHWTEAEAVRFLASLLGCKESDVTANPDWIIRQAEFKKHPDRDGNVDDFKKVQRARELLLAAA